MRLLTLGCALFSLAAVADPKPTLAAWPIEFSADSIFAPNQSEHQRQFVSTVRDACGLPTPLRSELMAAQSPLKGGSCATDDACLAKFAQVTHARYALSAQLSVTSAGTVSMTGRIVRDDSVRVREGTVQLKTGKLSNADVLKKLTELLLLELETASLQM